MNISTKDAIKKFNIRPSKSLGQNFLTDNNIIKRIVDAADVNDNDLVIEIGPGLGGMTSELAARAGRVMAVEIDKHLIPVLNENLKNFTNVHILNKDILKVDINADLLELPELKQTGFKPSGFKVIANLPYYITTPVIMKLLEGEIFADMMVFMVQKEVADRIAAKPGGKEYGALSVAVQYYSKPAKVFDVPPQCFIPQPGVDSSVVKFDILKTPPVPLEDKELFFRIVRASFGQRRKTLVNALYNSGYFNADKDKIKDFLRNVGIGENQRGETLTIMQFAELSNFIFKNS
jgi:16S rRNA (adenine1518-N6/adenine1519-N6)-dimethyltransferase